MSPMCQGRAHDGLADDYHLVHYGARALGGIGLAIVEATAVHPDGRIGDGDLGLWDDRHIAPLARVAGFLRAHGATAGIQIGHAGRKANSAQRIAPSALPFALGDPAPRALAAGELPAVVEWFAAAARRAAAAGFQVVEVHAAHGYLLHQFLSPLSNRRDDAHGGDRDGRMRLPLAVVAAVRAALPPAVSVFVRISATDWVAGGWELDDAVAFSRAAAALGAELIDVSSGGSVPKAEIPVRPGYQVPFAAEIRRQAGIATGAVGRIAEPGMAERIVVEGLADLVLLGTPLLREPAWAQRAARDLELANPLPAR
ncbi:MAG: oxidoreductase [Planctomycetes bacterium]|nr:oxidoreductase [Planctomycetota bacterium]